MKSKILYFIIFISSLLLGLFIRSLAPHFHWLVNLMLGDIVWAFMVYYFIRLLFTHKSILSCLLISLLFTYTIEFSQLIQNDFFNYLRSFKLIALVIGYGFLGSDLVSYTVGIVLGYLLDRFYLENKAKN
jgi:hypothetical protein